MMSSTGKTVSRCERALSHSERRGVRCALLARVTLLTQPLSLLIAGDDTLKGGLGDDIMHGQNGTCVNVALIASRWSVRREDSSSQRSAHPPTTLLPTRRGHDERKRRRRQGA